MPLTPRGHMNDNDNNYMGRAGWEGTGTVRRARGTLNLGPAPFRNGDGGSRPRTRRARTLDAGDSRASLRQ